MKKIVQFCLWSSLLCVSLFAPSQGFCNERKDSFWHTQKKGVTSYLSSSQGDDEWLKKAKKYQADFITTRVDAIGLKNTNPDQVLEAQSLVIKRAEQILQIAQRNNFNIVFQLPLIYKPQEVEIGCGWGGDYFSQDQHIAFWEPIVSKLKGCSALVGYSIPALVEDRVPVIAAENPLNQRDLEYSIVSRWLNGFYGKVVESIRRIDSETAIIVQSRAGLISFKDLEPVKGKNIIYSTTTCPKQCHPLSPDAHKTWTRAEMKNLLKEIVLWTQKYDISPQQILISDIFLPSRADQRAADFAFFVNQFDASGWHWAYSY